MSFQRYRCRAYTAQRCHGCLIRNAAGMFVTNGVHNHPNDRATVLKYQFMNWCRQEAVNSNIPLYSIYLLALRQFPGRPPVQFPSIRSSLYRARHASVPENPRDAQHYAELIAANNRYR
jgi:hypothetical protein